MQNKHPMSNDVTYMNSMFFEARSFDQPLDGRRPRINHRRARRAASHALKPVLSLLANEPKTLPPWIKIVATSRDEAQIKATLKGYTPSELRVDEARNRQDVRAYLTELAKEHVFPIGFQITRARAPRAGVLPPRRPRSCLRGQRGGTTPSPPRSSICSRPRKRIGPAH
jgi:hypothetical protein